MELDENIEITLQMDWTGINTWNFETEKTYIKFEKTNTGLKLSYSIENIKEKHAL